MAGLSAEQRAELADLMAADACPTWAWPARWPTCSDALRQARPDLPWGQRGQVPDGEQALGLGDATSARRRARRPRGAVQPAVAGLRRARRWPTSTRSCSSGRSAGRRSTTSPRCASWSASCERQGYLNRVRRQARAVPEGGAPAGRHRAAPGVRQARRHRPRRPRRRPTPARPGSSTGSSREWQFGDEQPLDVVRTVKNAVLRTAARAAGARASGGSGSPSRTSRSSRPSGAPAPPSRCWSTCPTRWRCAAPGARRSRPRWRCTRW